VKFGERGKSFGRHSPTSILKRGFDRAFDHGCVQTWSRGLIGFIGEVFEVMTQVDLGLTSAGQFDSADPVISVNDIN
jgi:hypothetical protein